MSSRPSLGYWLIFIVINIAISALTTWFVVRQLIPSPSATRVVASPTALATPSPAAGSDIGVTPTGSLTNAGTPETVVVVEAPTGASATPVEAPAGAPAPAATSDVQIRITAVIYPGQPSREVVVIDNESGDINLGNWTIISPRGKSFTFGNLTLYKNSFINIHTTNGTNTPTDLFWNQTEPIWQSGDQVQLKQGDKVVATYTVK